uniref:Uncharacterized protein n=1 Tax=Urocitellus parryii TaxID=9999 RepID=A0A8D2HKB3_UROPR
GLAQGAWDLPSGFPVPSSLGKFCRQRASCKAHTQHFSPPSLPLSLQDTIWGLVCTVAFAKGLTLEFSPLFPKGR